MSGPLPGANCTVCAHPRVSEVNADCNAGILSSRKIAARWGLSKDAVNRHRYKLHEGVVSPAQRGATQPPAQTVSEIDTLRAMKTQLEAEMAQRPRSDTSRELRQVVSRIAEIEGSDRPREASLSDVAGLAEQVARWFRALERYPEAREAMLAATDPELLGAAGVSR